MSLFYSLLYLILLKFLFHTCKFFDVQNVVAGEYLVIDRNRLSKTENSSVLNLSNQTIVENWGKEMETEIFIVLLNKLIGLFQFYFIVFCCIYEQGSQFSILLPTLYHFGNYLSLYFPKMRENMGLKNLKVPVYLFRLFKAIWRS